MKQLMSILPKKSGRGVRGRITVRHQGGRQKRFLREIDFKRNKEDIWARVAMINYEPNRNANIALLVYADGDKKYILAPSGLKEDQKVISSDSAPLDVGNCLPLAKIPVGTQIHNIEIKPGKGGQMVKSAGGAATVHGKEDDWVLVKLPSGEIRRFKPEARATLGQVGNEDQRTKIIGKAGRKRRMGKRPTVRGVAQHPGAHPHGGGEGRSGVGMKHQKTPYGKAAVGKTRVKKKYSNKLVIKGRKKGKHSK
jgi:large subunit ribosomal protein L2